MDRTSPSTRPILALLDDSDEGGSAIEWSVRLAQTMQRSFELVYLESTPALLAAAMPGSRVLAHAGAQWAPFSPPDVERGFRMQAERLRALAEAITLRHTVSWSLRIERGALPNAAFGPFADEQLLLLGAPLPLQPLWPRRSAAQARHAPLVAGASDGSAAGERSVAVARQLAGMRKAGLQVLAMAPGADAADVARHAGLQRSDLLVLPRALASRRGLLRAPCPVLLVA